MPKPTGMPCKGMCWNFTYKCRLNSVEQGPIERDGAGEYTPRYLPMPTGDITWSWGIKPVTSSGTGWSPVTQYLGHVDGEKWRHKSPNTAGHWMQQHWSVQQISVSSSAPRPPGSLWNVECQPGGGDIMNSVDGVVHLQGEFAPLVGKLWADNLGVLVVNDIPYYRDQILLTMLTYNQRHYGPNFASAPAVKQKPKHFPVTDCFQGGDSDYNNALWGLTQMDRIGFHGLCYDNTANIHTHAILKGLGQDLTIAALVGSLATPFVSPATGGAYNTSIMDNWATRAAAAYKAAGWQMSQVANMAIMDEPLAAQFPANSPEVYMNASSSIYASRMKAEWVAYLKQQKPPVSARSPPTVPLSYA